MQQVYDMIVVGGGPAGYTAALYAARAGMTVLVLEKMTIGGQMSLTDRIDNYPGFAEGVDGITLGMNMQAGAERFGAKTEYAEVISLDLQGKIKRIVTTAGEFEGRSVVIATGASPRPLGAVGEEELVGGGVHYCAHCDGRFYKNRTVIVVGGGNSAVEDALYLSNLASKVYLVHRRDTLRATKVYHEPLKRAQNVEFIANSAVFECLTDPATGRLGGVTLRHVVTGELTRLMADALFVSIGRDPATELLRGQLELDEGGYIVADETTKTSIPCVYAVGDVRKKALRQVVTAVADGAVAAHFAEQDLARGDSE